MKPRSGNNGTPKRSSFGVVRRSLNGAVSKPEMSVDVNEMWRVEGGYLKPPRVIEPYCMLHLDGTLQIDNAHRGAPELQSYIARSRELAACGKARALAPVYVDGETLGLAKREGRHAISLESDRMDQAKRLLAEGCQVRASDIHIYILRDYAVVRFRVDGELRDHARLDRGEARDLLRSIYEAMSDVHDRAYYEQRRQDARIGLTEHLPSGVHGVRIATTATDVGTMMVMRLLYADMGKDVGVVKDDFRPLGYTAAQNHAIHKMMCRAHGINVIAGVTGSGKSTLLKYVMEAIGIAHPGYHMLTVEDPPEYPIMGANQMPVTNVSGDMERELAYNDAVRGTLRLDPDVVMIGEVRDRGTLLAAIRLAQTGQKVWATTHADDALLVFARFFAMGIERDFLLDSSVLTGLVSQRLVPLLCPHCAREYPLTGEGVDPGQHARLLALADRPGAASLGDIRLRNRSGCPQCNRGIRGRTVVAETVDVSQSLLDLVASSGAPGARRYWLEEEGGVTLTAHAAHKVFAGILDPGDGEEIAGYFEGERMQNLWQVEG